ncbi:MAG TPA: histidine phosphatase family protein [Roseiflexaceae bacterium]|nr:histidine phosphatase family protein [Roseiflexaceae bacterium]
MRVYLIRHAQSEENILDLKRRTTLEDFNAILRRSPEVALTPLGMRQAQAVAASLAGVGIERLYTSPFVRARSTAAAIGAALGLEPVVLEELREVLPQIRERPLQPASLRRFFVRSYVRMLWPRGLEETWLSSYRRARLALNHITATPAEAVAAVSHRGLIGLLLLAARRRRGWRVIQRDLSNGGISIIASRER